MPKVNDLTGMRFGRLTVLSRVEDYVSPKGYRKTKWKCICDCGNTICAMSGDLKKGDTKSCGCLKQELDLARFTKHGGKGTKLYAVWKGIKSRCYNPHHCSYNYYGGRGITMCDDWIHSYENFRDWAYANGYVEGLTVDRIDPNGIYSPENCRFATRKEQANNKRKSIKIEYNGVNRELSWWAEQTGIKYDTLHDRVKRGWSVEKILQLN